MDINDGIERYFQYLRVEKGVTEDTKFYINEAGNPVVVFEKYEIAPGAAGRPEFEIAG